MISSFFYARYIKMSSPHLNNLIIVGCMLTYLSVIFLGLDSSLSSIGMSTRRFHLKLLSMLTLLSFMIIFMFSLTFIGSKVTLTIIALKFFIQSNSFDCSLNSKGLKFSNK